MTPEQFEAVGGKVSDLNNNEWTRIDGNAAVVVRFNESNKVYKVECYEFGDYSVFGRMCRWLGL
jgi:hypothetical protein